MQIRPRTPCQQPNAVPVPVSAQTQTSNPEPAPDPAPMLTYVHLLVLFLTPSERLNIYWTWRIYPSRVGLWWTASTISQ